MADDPTDPETEATEDGATSDVDPVVDDTPTAAAGEDDKRDTADTASATDEVAGKAAGRAKTKGPAGAVAPAGNVVRKKVVSRRVTPKGGPVSARSGAGNAKPGAAKPQSKAARTAAGEDHEFESRRYTPPSHNDMLPSPWWVPALMFGLLIVGAVIIMANYMGAFGDAENIRLVIGLAFILGGIVTATQYR